MATRELLQKLNDENDDGENILSEEDLIDGSDSEAEE